MDILFPLLFAAIAYFGPKLVEKLWKGYRSKIADYVKLQQNGRTGNRETRVVHNQVSTYAPSANEYQLEGELEFTPIVVPVHVPLAASNPPPVEEKVWSGKMDVNAVIQGMIFAEIVQPPRAYRPFVHRK
jgi:hypothetical protein